MWHPYRGGGFGFGGVASDSSLNGFGLDAASREEALVAPPAVSPLSGIHASFNTRLASSSPAKSLAATGGTPAPAPTRDIGHIGGTGDRAPPPHKPPCRHHKYDHHHANNNNNNNNNNYYYYYIYNNYHYRRHHSLRRKALLRGHRELCCAELPAASIQTRCSR